MSKKFGKKLVTRFDVSKQAFLEKVGSSGAVKTEESETFKKGKAVLKQCRISLNEIVKETNSFVKHLHGTATSMLALAEGLRTYAEHLGAEAGSGAAFNKFGEIQVELHKTATHLAHNLIANVIKPLQTFIEQDVQEARNMKNEFYRARVAYDALRSKHIKFCADKLESKNAPLKLLELERELAGSKESFERLKIVAEDQLLEIEKQIDFRVMDNLRSLLEMQLLFFQTGSQMLQEVLPYLKQLESFSMDSQVAFKNEQEQRSLQLAEYDRQRQLSMNIPFVELLANPDTAFLTCVYEYYPLEETEAILDDTLRVLDVYGHLMPLIKSGITSEVSTTTSATTLFRVNTTATRLMTAYMKQVGQGYLKDLFDPLFESIVEQPEGYEVDPNKIGPDDSLEANVANLNGIAQSFLDGVLSSLDFCPWGIRMIASHLQKEVAIRFPESRESAVGGLLFLRFICPGITKFGTSITLEGRRALILVTKVLQNLANGVEFGAKEPYMAPLNSFIVSNKDVLFKWFNDVSTLPPDTDEWAATCDFNRDDTTDEVLPRLLNKLVCDLDNLGKRLLQKKQTDALLQFASVVAGREQLISIQGGEAPFVAKISRAVSAPNRERAPITDAVAESENARAASGYWSWAE